MTAQTATIADFLLARIAEDETEAHRWIARRQSWSGESFDVFTAGSEERVLADCEAKRRIVEEALDYSPELASGDNGEWAFSQTLRLLALPHAEHPDYRADEWSPC
jgi:hypothetical protein